MRTTNNIQHEGNTTACHGVNGMFFCLFSPKKSISQSSLNHYLQRTFEVSPSCSFNGKEKDYESGFHYYGARYYWSELLTGWLSVDPMADKYPNISPYAYCAWNPVKLVDLDGNEAIDNDDWYKDEKGRLKWDPSVTSETTLKEGEEYLGKTVLLTNSEGQTLYGNENGEVHTYVSLPEISITEKSGTVKKDADFAVPISFGTFLLNNLSTIVGTVVDAAIDVIGLVPACLLFSSDSSPNQDVRGGHDNNVRKSTKGKHESGDRRRLQDQQGSKGEHMVKGKRPKGYKGPWPPKKKQ